MLGLETVTGIELKTTIPKSSPPVVGVDANWYDTSRYKRNGTLDSAVTWERIASGIYVPHFTGSATSNANFGALFNASVKWWISFWFKLDTAFSSSSPAVVYLWGKFVDGADYTICYLDSADGKLTWFHRTGGVTHFSLKSAETSWVVDNWYHTISSISDVAKARLRINAGTAQTNANGNAVVNGGDFVIGSLEDGADTGVVGEISHLEVGTFDLTESQEWSIFQKERHYFGK